MAVLKIKADSSGEWIAVPALRGNDGKSAYEIAVEAGYTGTETQYTEILLSLENFATKEYVDDEILIVTTTLNELTEAIENRYTKEEVDALLQGGMSYKGSVDNLDALDVIMNPASGDIYQCKADGKNYIWNGTEWEEFGSTIDLSGYVTFTDLEAAVEVEANNRIEADILLQADIAAEALARGTRDDELEAMINDRIAAEETLQEAIDSNKDSITDLSTQVTESTNKVTELETTIQNNYDENKVVTDQLREDLDSISGNQVTEHNNLEGRDAEDCHPMSAITNLNTTLDGMADNFAEMLTNTTTPIVEALNNKLNVGETYTREEIDDLIAGAFEFKGSVENEASLPTDAGTGDLYIDLESNDSFLWDGENWNNLGPLINLDSLATKEELTATDERLQDEINDLKNQMGDDLSSQMTDINDSIAQLEEDVSKKADADDVYTKEEADKLYDEKQDKLTVGFGLLLNEDTAFLEAEKQVTIPDYSAATIYTSLPFTATESCTVIGSTYSVGGGYSVKVNEVVIVTGQGWSNFTVTLREGDIISADATLDTVNLSVMSLGYAVVADTEILVATPDYAASANITSLPYVASQACMVLGAVYAYGGGYTLDVNGVDVASAQGWSPVNITMNKGEKLSSDITLDVVNLNVAPVTAASFEATVDGTKVYWGNTDPDESWGNPGDIYVQLDDIADEDVNIPS